MGVYQGLALFKKGRGFFIRSCLNARGTLLLGPSCYQFHISVNENDQLEEMVRTVVHELLHISYEHADLPIDSWGDVCMRPPPKGLEEKIEEEVQTIALCQPLLMNYLKSYLWEYSKG